ncbi:Thiamine pyrophosphate enzyme, C-terminal TPP binding domain [Arthrobacter sp. yr096]|uniref:thiamine pyrophosphate-dependent enzyme n=1 Tax=Arthrobacter sp. yr096 TaxID=1761750 RepID=UPI0008C6ADF7|nr:thiamine pyrophosphate-dependent enzyme [Arthrobacter sp. yr096]SEJ78121.1 Thiamine pyrophosphate enzyme, C-terminal TPP binding domain [Arthrobacter sp. yr096]
MTELLHRREVIRELLSEQDLLVVSSLGAPSWDITDAGDTPTSFPLWGAMGGAAMCALGIALAQPERRVVCVAGDGEMLMAMGSLATVAVQKPDNLTIVVVDNGHYGETGMQLTHTSLGVDLTGIAHSAGIADSRTVRTWDEVAPLKDRIYNGKGPGFARVVVDPEIMPVILPPKEGSYLKNRFRIAVLGQDAVYA